MGCTVPGVDEIELVSLPSFLYQLFSVGGALCNSQAYSDSFTSLAQDLPRTHFDGKGVDPKALLPVLQATSLMQPEIGYVQGMAYCEFSNNSCIGFDCASGDRFCYTFSGYTFSDVGFTT